MLLFFLNREQPVPVVKPKPAPLQVNPPPPAVAANYPPPPLSPPPTTQPTLPPAGGQPRYVKVKYDFVARNRKELTIMVGETLEVSEDLGRCHKLLMTSVLSFFSVVRLNLCSDVTFCWSSNYITQRVK